MPDVVRVSSCRLCDSADLALVVSFTPTPPGDQYLTEPAPQPSYPLDLVCCRACGAVQLADTVDPALIYPEYLYTTSVSRGLEEHFHAYAKDVVTRLRLKDHSFIVDIGSNDGTFLRMCDRMRPYFYQGIEPCAAIAAAANEAGVPTYCAFFSKAVAAERLVEHGSVDLIAANHVMANVADLHDFIDGVKLLLAVDGTFVFETGYWPAIVNHHLIDTIEHEHIHYFAVKPLQRFLAAHGLTLVHVETNRAKGGSLRGYVQHAGAAPDATVAECIRAEDTVGYADEAFLKGWVRDIQALVEDMHVQIAEATDDTWVGYGAAVGSTLLLHQFGLGEKLTCLVDANPQKQGRVSPGYHLPVYDPGRLADLRPDKIVILAWRYAERIQRQHPEYAGKWILPLPQLVTV